MKNLFLIVCIVCLRPAFAQDDFLSVYNKMVKARERQSAIKNQMMNGTKDTSLIKAVVRQNNKFLSDSILPIVKEVINLTFPDINFTDVNNKAYSISDFSGKDVIVNYNYLYCQGCLNRIDSTLKLIDNGKVQMLVLFKDQYQKDAATLKEYNQNVTIGFLTEENVDLISLTLGDNSMYYLNGKRQIEFFDKTDMEAHNYNWNSFLKNRNK